MKLSTRLAIAVAVVLLGTLAALSAVLVQSTRATLLTQVDRDLRDNDAWFKRSDTVAKFMSGSNDGDADSGRPAAGGGGGGGSGPQHDVGGPGKRQLGTYICGPDGQIYIREAAGYEDQPLADPDLTDLPLDGVTNVRGRVLTVSAVDGSLRYRILVDQLAPGAYAVSASPLQSVDDAVGHLMGVFAGLGAAALLIAVLACWLLIRRGLQPVDRMVGTTAAIAAGDLSLRVDAPDPRTELGRLGGAINVMLGQIEQAYRARTASEERLRRFVADAAHELRTPLTSLRGYAELYRQGALADQGGVDSAMRRIESEGARMARLVDDLLLLARMDQQRGVERKPVELVGLLHEAIQDLHAIDPTRPVTEALPAQATVLGDRVRLRQIIDNLLANVRTHTPSGTPVHIALAEEPGAVSLAVSDEGPGIAEEDRARIFERFWRADPSRSRSKGGTGLGLSIVASLVEAHGGAISVASAVGEGTTFTIRLPTNGPGTVVASAP